MFRRAVLVPVLLVASACALSDDGLTQRVELPSFDAIEVHADLDVGVLFGESQHVEVACEQGSAKLYEFDVRSETLYVLYGGNERRRPEGCVADLRMWHVHRLANFGSGALTSPADLAGRIDEIELSGSGSIELATAGVDALDVWLAGSGDVTVGGDYGGVRATQRLSVHHDGSGYATLRDADLQLVEVAITGDGTALVSGAADQLDVFNEGTGKVGAVGLIARLAEVDLTGGTTVIFATERVEGRVVGDATLAVFGPATVDVHVGPDATLVRR